MATLKKSMVTKHEEIPPGHWAIISDAHGENELVMCCPVCKLARWIPHEVDGTGNVKPSVVCMGMIDDGSTCSYHEFVQLEDWNHGFRMKRVRAS